MQHVNIHKISESTFPNKFKEKLSPPQKSQPIDEYEHLYIFVSSSIYIYRFKIFIVRSILTSVESEQQQQQQQQLWQWKSQKRGFLVAEDARKRAVLVRGKRSEERMKLKASEKRLKTRRRGMAWPASRLLLSAARFNDTPCLLCSKQPGVDSLVAF